MGLPEDNNEVWEVRVFTTMMRLGKWVTLLLSLVWPLYSFAGIDGQYQGEFHGKKVTAVLETMSTTVTGVLAIGAENYLLRAEVGSETIPGQLNSMTSGKTLKLLIKPVNDAINVEVNQTGAEMMRFTLKRTQ